MSDKLKVLLIVLDIALILGGFIAYDAYKDYLHPNPEETVGNVASNLNNGGYVCQFGDKVYFANAYDDNRLYVMKADETGMKCLTDSPVSMINADKRHIYYYINNMSSVSGMGGFTISMLGLYRVGADGNKAKCLDKVTCGKVQLIGNELFYQRYDNDAGIALQKMDIRSKQSEPVMTFDANPASVADGRIIYSGSEKDHFIYIFDPASGTSTLLAEINAWNPEYQNGFIYYMSIDDDYALCRYNIGTGEVQKLTEDRCDGFVYSDGYIVYQKNSQTSPALMMMNADGSGSVQLAEGNFTGLGTANGVVYFEEFGMPTPMYKVNVRNGGTMQIFQAAQDAVPKKRK